MKAVWCCPKKTNDSKLGKPGLAHCSDRKIIRSAAEILMPFGAASIGSFASGNGLGRSKKLREWFPDLIIRSFGMPFLDVYRFAITLKTDERTATFPLILLTARLDESRSCKGCCQGSMIFIQPNPLRSGVWKTRGWNLIGTKNAFEELYHELIWAKGL